ncbi:MAG: hypothetical protein Ct9H90mP27_4840 [Gammaproteobacteria bacterium]|nr:MAG: hypothetical protein Ct9H90mP27_4840 [Gammaproteobacteria bacterium]
MTVSGESIRTVCRWRLKDSALFALNCSVSLAIPPSDWIAAILSMLDSTALVVDAPAARLVLGFTLLAIPDRGIVSMSFNGY